MKKKKSQRRRPRTSNASRSLKTSRKTFYHGLVLSVLGKGYTVDVNGEVWKCRPRGRLFKGPRSSRPVVGDRVLVEPRNEPLVGVISEVEERRSVLARTFPETGGEQVLAANIDQVLICMAVKNPPFRAGLIDRYLVTCEALELEPILVLNKVDLATDEEIEEATSGFRSIGYQVIHTSATQSLGIDALKELIDGSCSVFTGPSGAGKSSLTNAIEPDAQLLTGRVNELTGKGRHTTTASQLIRLADGFVMDTPGIREFAPWGIEPTELASFFVEFRPFLGRCQFRDCHHIAEPSCRIKEALAAGEIEPRRYESFKVLMEEFKEEQKEF